MDEDDLFDDDDFRDIDEQELIAVTTQVEKRVGKCFLNSSNKSNEVEELLHAALNDSNFNSSDELEESNEFHSETTNKGRAFTSSLNRQRTLFGGRKENEKPTNRMGGSSHYVQRGNNASAPAVRQNWRMLDSQEPPTHHCIDRRAAATWVYPINYSVRDYQFNIVHRALLNNILVALPTGLGKTFIAAVVMYNWYRWAPDAQIAFMAPTKPLIAQQMDACYDICGIPKSQTALLTGQVTPARRAELWANKRIFYATPQTLESDLKRGYADPKRFVCLVIDEAHRAVGNFAYVKVVEFIRRFNQSFRVLALTATPGSKVETVQDVIDVLGIGRVEIRTEQSIDIRQYVHQKNVKTIPLELSDEIKTLKDAFARCVKPILDYLRSKNVIHIGDPENLSAYNVTQAKNKWVTTPAFHNMGDAKWAILKKLQFLAQLAYPMSLIDFHGVRCFYKHLKGLKDEVQSAKTDNRNMKLNFFGSSDFKNLMLESEKLINEPDFYGHPKLGYLVGAVLEHFVEARESCTFTETRIMIFSSYRDSAAVIVDILKNHEPTVKPSIFIGQQDGKSGAGMSQKEQLEVISKFQRGIYNTLVATSIGEEGLDIGEVDLIICYDASSSPIRMLQRMGRTGRKRDGTIIVLLTKGKEEEKFAQAKDNYSYMQNMIATGDKFNYRQDLSPRILPKEITPECSKQHIMRPAEESVPISPKKGRGIRKKAPPKKFHMPDGVQTGFAKASEILQFSIEDSDDDKLDADVQREMDDLAPPWDVKSETGLLQENEERELQRNYMSIYGAEEDITIAMPDLGAHPDANRSLTPTQRIGHGRAAKSLVRMMAAMREIDREDTKILALEANFHKEDVDRHHSAEILNTEDSQEESIMSKIGIKRKLTSNTTSPGVRSRNGFKSTKQILSNYSLINISSGKDTTSKDAKSPLETCDITIIDSDVGSTQEPCFDTDSEIDDLPDVTTVLNSATKRAKRTKDLKERGSKKRRIEDSDDLSST